MRAGKSVAAPPEFVKYVLTHIHFAFLATHAQNAMFTEQYEGRKRGPFYCSVNGRVRGGLRERKLEV